MRLGFALIAVLILIAIPLLTAGMGLGLVFGVIIPYLALAIFVFGFVVKMLRWARIPVPFRITTTTGQAKSLPWMKRAPMESPYNGWETFWRMVLEVVLFRSLFRNTVSELKGGRVLYGSTQWLWLAGIIFHYSFLVILLAFLRRYIPHAGLGTLVAMMIPYAIAFGVAWLVLLVAWMLIGAALGPAGPLSIPVAG